MSHRRKHSRKFNTGGILVVAIIIALAVGMFIRVSVLHDKTQEYEAQIAELNESIAAENERSEKLEDYASYVTTDEYAEKVARTKLGLVYEGETVYKEED